MLMLGKCLVLQVRSKTTWATSCTHWARCGAAVMCGVVMCFSVNMMVNRCCHWPYSEAECSAY
jgi:hypothetical protein